MNFINGFVSSYIADVSFLHLITYNRGNLRKVFYLCPLKHVEFILKT